MAKFKVTVEGANYAVEAPDENTAWEWANITHKQSAPQASAPPPETTLPGLASEAGKGFVRGASDVGMTIGKGVAKAINPILGNLAGYGIDKLAGPGREVVSASPNTPTERMVGTGSEILGGSAVTGGMGSVPKAAYSGISALGGALGEQAGGETGKFIGSLASIPVSSGVSAAKAVKNYVYPSVGHIGVKAAGDRTEAVIKALRENSSDVPGVNLHSGQASVPANSAEFAALQRRVADIDPSRYFGPGGVEGQQAGARLSSVQNIGGTPEDLAIAKQSRGNIANHNYGVAYDEAIKADPKLAKMAQNPYFKAELPAAIDLAKAKGINPKENLTEFLHYVKEGLDARLQSLANPNAPAIATSAKGAIADLKKELVSWLGEKNPRYEVARIRHESLSQPINQMKVGQDLERALTAPATEAERVGAFGSAIRRAETGVSKATGKPRIQDLTPEQQAALSAIENDFKTNSIYKDLASKGAKNLENRIGAPELPPTGFFQPMVSAARGWVNRILGSGVENAIQRSSPAMADPKVMARLMREYNSTIGHNTEEAARRAALAAALYQGEQP